MGPSWRFGGSLLAVVCGCVLGSLMITSGFPGVGAEEVETLVDTGIHFDPDEKVSIPRGEQRNVTLNIMIHHGPYVTLTWPGSIVEGTIVDHTGVGAIANHSNGVNLTFLNGTGSMTLDLRGVVIGKGELDVTFHDDSGNLLDMKKDSELRYQIIVAAPESVFGAVTMIGIFVGFALNLFGFSLTVRPGSFSSYIRKPVELGLIVCLQFAILPCVAFFLGWVMDCPFNNRFSLIALAACPSGAFSNICSLLLNSKLDLNILGLVVTPIFAAVFSPLWVYTLGGHILNLEDDEHRVKIPWFGLLGLLLLFLLPGIIGLALAHYYFRPARILSLVIRPLAIIWVCVMVGLTCYDYWWVLDYGAIWSITASAMILPFVGGIFGFSTGYAFRRDVRTATTVMLQCATPNPSFALMFSNLMIPKPYGILGYATIGIYFFTLAGSVGVLFVLRLIYGKLYPSSGESSDVDDEKTDAWKEVVIVNPPRKTEDEFDDTRKDIYTVS